MPVRGRTKNFAKGMRTGCVSSPLMREMTTRAHVPDEVERTKMNNPHEGATIPYRSKKQVFIYIYQAR